MNRLKVQIVMLPTDKATRLYLYTKDNSLTYYHKPQQGGGNYPEVINQNLYILSDEEIVPDIDWKIDLLTNRISKAKSNYDGMQYIKKIISSTDEFLKLPRPSDAFLKKYCEMNGGIKYAYVEMEEVNTDYHIFEDRLKVASDNTISIFPVRESSTLHEMYVNMQYYMEYCQTNDYVTPQDWIEKYKHF